MYSDYGRYKLMLINCPECKKEISDQSEVCIYCGYPIAKIKKKYDVKINDCECPLCKQNSHILKGVEDTCSVCGYVFNHEECKRINPDWTFGNKSKSKSPQCPKCGSTSITTGARGINLMWGLIGASKTVNRCANCGHTWKPK